MRPPEWLCIPAATSLMGTHGGNTRGLAVCGAGESVKRHGRSVGVGPVIPRASVRGGGEVNGLRRDFSFTHSGAGAASEVGLVGQGATLGEHA